MIALHLSKAPDATRGPHDHTWEIQGNVVGLAIARDLLAPMLSPAELETLPPGNQFFVAMHGGELGACCCESQVPLMVDGIAVAPTKHATMKDRGTLTLKGLTFTYTVKYA